MSSREMVCNNRSVRLLMEKDENTLTIINKYPEIQRVNDELRSFASKQRARKYAHSVSRIMRQIEQQSFDKSSSDSERRNVSTTSRSIQRSQPDSSRVSQSDDNKISSTMYRKKKYEDWKRYKLRKERKKRKFLQNYIKTHPYVSQYKRDYILKYGKPTFMLNAQKYLLRQNFVINNRNHFSP